MLRALALMMFATLASLAGCVVPMPIEPEPVEQNLPPFYLTPSVSPPFNQLIEFDPELAEALELRTGPIGDPNPGDRIFFRWFFNYLPNGFPFIAEEGPPEGRSLASLVDGAIVNRLTPCIDLTTNAFRETDLHRIEVVIADRPFVSDVEGTQTPNQTVAEGGYLLRIVWFVRVDRSKCP